MWLHPKVSSTTIPHCGHCFQPSLVAMARISLSASFVHLWLAECAAFLQCVHVCVPQALQAITVVQFVAGPRKAEQDARLQYNLFWVLNSRAFFSNRLTSSLSMYWRNRWKSKG